MSALETILKASFELLKAGKPVEVQLDSRNIGMAYAIPPLPSGASASMHVESYAPWTRAELRQPFRRTSSIFGTTLVDMELILSWEYSASQQYIINAYLKPNVRSIDPTVDIDAHVTFLQGQPWDPATESYQIPFELGLVYDPVGGNEQPTYRGVLRSDGTGEFVAD